MYKYEYVTVSIKLAFASAKLIEHREIIDKYAKNGYRYVGYVPTKQEMTVPCTTEIDLIFEKREE